jgi:multisubunit Na+/H+ antiporter MnhB subunit
MIEPELDAVIALSLLALAWRVQRVPELFTAVALYIVFGLVMALVWVRLAAPDIALAEAAVGAGLTGALLLDAVRSLPTAPRAQRSSSGRAGAVLTGAGVAIGGAAMLMVVLRVDVTGRRIAPAVEGALGGAGVESPVTAVLLNFRGYDTWLEVMVLLAALLTTLVVRRSHSLHEAEPRVDADGVLAMISRTLTPSMVLVAAYLLWLGTSAAGGAFQAGAVLGAAGIVLFLTGRRSITALSVRPLRAAAVAGAAGFVATGAWALIGGRHLLELPRSGASAKWIITAVEGLVAISVGVTLAALYVAARPRRSDVTAVAGPEAG